jgi:hypothetical integral membrane protein (TIGR02206 family)
VERFIRFGDAHWSALAAVLIVTLLLVSWARHAPERRQAIARGLAIFVVAVGLGYVAIDASHGKPWSQIAPLHLCDVAIFLSAWALWRRHQLAYELTHFWGLAGTVPALLWPDLLEGFPHYRFLFYFGQHGAIVVAALFATFGLTMRPRRRSPIYAWLVLNGYAAVLAVVNAVAGTNFLYLMEPPGAGSPLDLFGPWPWYILGGEVIALGSFVLLVTPFLRRRSA